MVYSSSCQGQKGSTISFALLQEDMQAWLAPKYRPVSLSSPQKMALFTRHVFCYRMKSRKHLLLLLVLVTPLCPKMLNWFSWSTTQKLFQRLTYKSCKLLSLLAFCCQSFYFTWNVSSKTWHSSARIGFELWSKAIKPIKVKEWKTVGWLQSWIEDFIGKLCVNLWHDMT